MPIKIDRSDRRLILWASLIFLVMMVALSILSSNDQADSGVPSSYSSQASGAKAAYLLLGELGYKVER